MTLQRTGIAMTDGRQDRLAGQGSGEARWRVGRPAGLLLAALAILVILVL